ncbi:hypothetical protein [Streptosporangium sp. NPDC087985]|uniref:hypothetical protein n=1 Tax=Streptosporangium sp. NPDC087985 TaxID=3366196 RepID=UPI003815CFBA
MPSRIPREDARYLGGTVPMLVLVSAAPVEQLPVFQLDAGRPLPCGGWQFLAGLAVSVVDGPGDSGILVEGIAHPDEAEERFAWMGAVDHAGGAVVLVVDSHSPVYDWDVLASSGKAQGGFVSAIQRSG